MFQTPKSMNLTDLTSAPAIGSDDLTEQASALAVDSDDLTDAALALVPAVGSDDLTDPSSASTWLIQILIKVKINCHSFSRWFKLSN